MASCDTSNPNAEIAKTAMGHSPAGLFGYSHMLGGFPGGQAEYLRVPFADVSPLKIESGLEDEKVLFLSDIFPTGYMGAENAEIEKGDTVAVWGCGPVGQFCIRSAWMLGAGRVIAIDRVPERLAMARDGKAETINFDEVNVYDTLMQMTKGRGPDRCIEAVGCEAHYAGTIDLDKVAENAPDDVADQYRKLAELSPTKKVPLDVWIGSDGLVRKISVDLDAPDASGQEGHASLAFELWDYGEAVAIDVPPASEVVDASALKG